MPQSRFKAGDKVAFQRKIEGRVIRFTATIHDSAFCPRVMAIVDAADRLVCMKSGWYYSLSQTYKGRALLVHESELHPAPEAASLSFEELMDSLT